ALESESFNHIRLQMNRWEVIIASNSLGAKISENDIAVVRLEQIIEPNDKHKPAHVRVILKGWQNQIAIGHKPVNIGVCNAPAILQDFIQPVHLRDTQRGVNFTKPIVVSQSLVCKPFHSFAALIAQGAASGGEVSSSVTIMPPSPVVICLFG